MVENTGRMAYYITCTHLDGRNWNEHFRLYNNFCITREFQKDIAIQPHDNNSHIGFDRLYAIARSKYYWPGMYTFLDDHGRHVSHVRWSKETTTRIGLRWAHFRLCHQESGGLRTIMVRFRSLTGTNGTSSCSLIALVCGLK